MQLQSLLCILSGDDRGIIETCNREGARVGKRFASIGFFVLIIFLICFVSSSLAIAKMFQSFWIGIPGGLLFSLTITNIYLFLLYTLSKDVHRPVEETRLATTGRYASIIGRLVFVWILAILVSKPIEVVVFSASIEGKLSAYKSQQLDRYRDSTNVFFDNEINDLHASIEQQRRLNGFKDTDQIRKELAAVEKRRLERERLIGQMEKLITSSSYYVRSIVILNHEFPICWVFTILIVAIFTVPAWVKNHIPASNLFYTRKRDIERRLIKEEYETFKTTYSRIFRERFGVELGFAEPFEDPPFNTLRKKDTRHFDTEENLIQRILDA